MILLTVPMSAPLLHASIADQLARMCELYGINPTLGRLYAALLTSSRPRALDELAEAVGAARSTASVAMRRLVDAGVVQRLPPRSDRRDWYVPITDPDEILRRWWDRYFDPEFKLWQQALGEAEALLGHPEALPADTDPAVLRARFDTLRAFIERWQSLLEAARPAAPAPAARRITVEYEP